MTYDQACYDLALSFIKDDTILSDSPDTDKLADKLAQLIQTTIEDFLDTEADLL